MAVELIEETLTRSIIGGFFEVYNTLGFGFLENVYKIALQRELGARGHGVAREVAVPVMYKGEEISRQRLGMIVDGKIVVETKSSYDLHKGARRQLFNYLKATNMEIGLLLHFGPVARFYREVRFNTGSNPRNPRNPFTSQ